MPQMTTLGDTGSQKKSSMLRATSFDKLLAAGQIINNPSLASFLDTNIWLTLSNALQKSVFHRNKPHFF
jgi:hypothetical protein